jgi:hypothetical protein
MRSNLIGTALLCWSGAVLLGCTSSPGVPPAAEVTNQRLALSGPEAFCTDYGRVSTTASMSIAGSTNAQCQKAPSAARP